MKSLAIEEFAPKDQKKEGSPITFKIKPLTSLQLTEVMQDGTKFVDGGMSLNFKGLILCLRYGLDDIDLINTMPSRHHAEVGTAIWKKALLSEDERKN
jgi:hypothetical protein